MSVVSRRGRLLPMRVGFYREGEAYTPDVLLSAVEPPSADLLELAKLSAFTGTVVYHASRNRQCHTYAVTERRDVRSQALRRVFSRCLLPPPPPLFPRQPTSLPSLPIQYDCRSERGCLLTNVVLRLVWLSGCKS